MMNPRTTWVVGLLAAVLFALIWFVRPGRHNDLRPQPVLKNFKATAVTSVQVRPSGTASLQIRADRTNNTWQLTEPLVYPAQAVSIDNLLAAIQRLTPVTRIDPAEYRTRPNADEEFGFAAPQASIILYQKNYRTQLLIGAMTNPGDQAYLQVVGVQGVYVVDAGLLKVIPRSANDWRDTTLLDLENLAFDRLAITNNANAVVLQRDLPNGPWRMLWPLSGARADNERIEDSLQKLQALRIERFVSDDPKADLERFGLAPPELVLALGRGTNTLILLQFGRSPTNDPGQVFARRAGEHSLFAVAKDLQAPWRKPVYDFRDPHLISVGEPVSAVEMRSGSEWFRVERQTNDTWRVLPQDFAADPVLVQAFVSELSGLRIAQFTKDVVNPAALPEFGLASPARKYVLEAAPASAPGTNRVIAELHFGFSTNQADKVFARRTDEISVYAVSTNDFVRLPSSGWQLRQRKLWNFSIDDVAAVTLRQDGRTRQIIRKGPHLWSLAPGSQGIINDLAVEETVRALVQASADTWVSKGEQQDCARYGLSEKAHEVTLELKDGRKAAIQFGSEAPSANRYAGVKVDGQLWILEFPWLVHRDVLSYLSVP